MKAHNLLQNLIQEQRAVLTESELFDKFPLLKREKPGMSAHEKLMVASVKRAFDDIERDPANAYEHLAKAYLSSGWNTPDGLTQQQTVALFKTMLRGVWKKVKFTVKFEVNRVNISWENGPSKRAVEEFLSDTTEDGKVLGYYTTNSGTRIHPYRFAVVRRKVVFDPKTQGKQIYQALLKKWGEDGVTNVPDGIVGPGINSSIRLGYGFVPGHTSYMSKNQYIASKKEVDKILGFELVEERFIEDLRWFHYWNRYGSFE